MSHAIAERPIVPDEDLDWVTLDEGWDPDDAMVYASIRAMRAVPLELSGAKAAAFVQAKQARATRAAKPLPLD
jgi:hypothetical protein